MQFSHFIGIGSNVGAFAHLPRAIDALLSISPEIVLSPVLETEAEGIASGRPFLNAVACVQTAWSARELKDWLNAAEARLGRDRSDPERGRKDRPIDLDILLSLPAGAAASIADGQVPGETYYRPQMLELVHALGYVCGIPRAPLRGIAAIEVGGRWVGSQTVRIGRHGVVGPVRPQRRAALVTGAAVRLGRAIAGSLAGAGYDIALHYNTSEEAAAAACAEFRQAGVRCEPFRRDLRRPDQLDALIEEAAEAFPGLEVLVNSASAYSPGRISETTAEQLERQWEVNFRAPFFLTKAFCARIERGSVVNVLDNKIAFNQYHYAAYLCSKKALAEFTKMAALEFAPRIRVNAVAPGVVLPSSARGEQYLRWRQQGIPVSEVGHPSHVCEAIADILANRFVTGQVLFVDGGEAINVVGRNTETFAALASA